MRVTIIVEDNRVNVEGFSEPVDCSAYDDIHVVQWYGDHGEIEWAHPRGQMTGLRSPTKFDNFDGFQHLVDEWEVEARKDAA